MPDDSNELVACAAAMVGDLLGCGEWGMRGMRGMRGMESAKRADGTHVGKEERRVDPIEQDSSRVAVQHILG